MTCLSDQVVLKNKLDALAASSGGQLPLDSGIQNALPDGDVVKSVHSHGQSAWSYTVKIDTTARDGTNASYFAKYVAGDLGKHQLEGEYIGMRELHQSAPELVVKPIGWGQLNEIPKCYYLLMEFKDLVPDLPDPVKLGRNLAMMHKNSKSPTGMFGFGIQTYDGARLQSVDWDPSWTSFFSKLLAEAYRQDKETNGVWQEMELVFARVQSHLIPRLIGTLESGGRSVRPCLIHGDLWDGNVATDAGNDNPVIFDCGAYYAHNEMELGIWRADRHDLKAEVFRQEYLRNFEASEPKEEWDDRNRLYSTKTNMMFSACYAGSLPRKLAYNDFLYLIKKYVPWDERTAEGQQSVSSCKSSCDARRAITVSKNTWDNKKILQG